MLKTLLYNLQFTSCLRKSGKKKNISYSYCIEIKTGFATSCSFTVKCQFYTKHRRTTDSYIGIQMNFTTIISERFKTQTRTVPQFTENIIISLSTDTLSFLCSFMFNLLTKPLFRKSMDVFFKAVFYSTEYFELMYCTVSGFRTTLLSKRIIQEHVSSWGPIPQLKYFYTTLSQLLLFYNCRYLYFGVQYPDTCSKTSRSRSKKYSCWNILK